MTYFPDLSPYAYGPDAHPGVVHVGWLDGIHHYPTGTVDSRLVEKMKLLARQPVELYRGRHICELCEEPPGLKKTVVPTSIVVDRISPWWQWAEQRSSNGEIRVRYGGVIFAAPVLIVHYIEEHRYLPPAEFLEAIAKAVC